MTSQLQPVTLKYQVDRADVFRALVGFVMRKFWFMLWMPIFGAIVIVWAAVDPMNGAVTVTQGAIMIAISTLIFLLSPFLQSRAVMKTPNFQAPMKLTVSESGIEFAGEHSNARSDWSLTNGASETNRSILINLKPAGFLIIPKREVDAADVTALRNLLRRYAPGKVKLSKES